MDELKLHSAAATAVVHLRSKYAFFNGAIFHRSRENIVCMSATLNHKISWKFPARSSGKKAFSF